MVHFAFVVIVGESKREFAFFTEERYLFCFDWLVLSCCFRNASLKATVLFYKEQVAKIEDTADYGVP